MELSLGGAFNVSNAIAAAHAAGAVGVDDEHVVAGLSRPLVVSGRFERVDAGQPFAVIVDYAHTPDGLDQLLMAADDLVGVGPDGERGRVVVVFGCGGDRDATKRPAMGEVAARRADRVVVTADNSRHEATEAIIEAVTQGFDRTHPRRAAELIIEPDRRRAIAAALTGARSGDVVLLAGKGHETTQVLGDEVLPFDDRVVAAEELARPRWSAVIRLLVAAGVALTVSLIGTLLLIGWLERRHIGQPIREDGPEGHITKAGTPDHGWHRHRPVRRRRLADQRLHRGRLHPAGLHHHARRSCWPGSWVWSTTASRSSGSATSG